MQISINQPELFGEQATNALFGGNILAPHGTMTGNASYGNAIDDLGVTGLRYPGGSLTEYCFDIEHPDATIVTDALTGAQTDFIPLSEFLTYAEVAGHGATIVIPTRNQLSQETDANGNRLPGIDEAVLRGFVHDVMTGTYGNANIQAFELGNEYWGSGEMNAVEYGRLAAEMSTIVKDELNLVSDTSSIDTTSTHVLVQMGTNFGHSHLSNEYQGWEAQNAIDDLLAKYPNADISSDNIYANGQVNWTAINNELIEMGYDTPEKQGSIDGVVAHVYSRGAANDNSKFFDLDNIDNTWFDDKGFENLDIHVTEWNQKSTAALDKTSDYGLYQAHEMLNIMESFMAHGVDAADVWPLIQNTSNPLSEGTTYSGKTVAGEMFSMMAENIPGKTMLDFTPGGDRETQLESSDVYIHGFVGDHDAAFYIASVADQNTTTDVNISGLIQSFDSMDIKILGVASGQAPGDTESQADIQTVNSDMAFTDGTLNANLDPGEIMQVVIHNFVPTDAFAQNMQTANDNTVGADPAIDPYDNSDELNHDDSINHDTLAEHDDNADIASAADAGWIMGLLPLVALLGLI